MLPKPNPSVLFQPLADGAILLNPKQEIYFGLNSVGAQIWNLLPPTCGDLHQVCAELSKAYPEVGVEVLATDVRELLEQLSEQGLVLGTCA